MRVCLLSYAFPPMRYPRAIQVAHLVRHSELREIEVVAADEGADEDEGLAATLPTATRVTRLPWGRRARLARGLRARTFKDRFLVPDLSRPWTRDAARHIIREGGLGEGDVIVTFGQPMSDHLAGRVIAKRTGARWIAHFSDPWAASPFRGGGRLARAINASQERATLAAADRIVFTSAETVELVARTVDLPRDRVTILPHAFDPALYSSRGEPEGPLRVRYVGNFYGHRGPESLFDGLAALHARDPRALDAVSVELIGSFAEAPPARDAEQFPDGLVRRRPRVPYREALELMRDADLLLVIDARAEHSVFLPSKLVEYLGARRPIVAITPPGTAADLTLRAGGSHADPADPESVATALATGLDAAREYRGRDWGDEVVIGRFAASRVAAEFDSVVQQTAAGA